MMQKLLRLQMSMVSSDRQYYHRRHRVVYAADAVSEMGVLAASVLVEVELIEHQQFLPVVHS